MNCVGYLCQCYCPGLGRGGGKRLTLVNMCHGSKNMKEATKYRTYVDDNDTSRLRKSGFWKMLLRDRAPPFFASSICTDLTDMKIAANIR